MAYYFWDANNEARKDITHISEKIKSIPEYNKLNDDLRKYSDDSISVLKKSINGDMDTLRKELQGEWSEKLDKIISKWDVSTGKSSKPLELIDYDRDFYEKEFINPLINKIIECETKKDLSTIENIYAPSVYLKLDDDQKEFFKTEIDFIKQEKEHRWQYFDEEYKLIKYSHELSNTGYLMISISFFITVKPGPKANKIIGDKVISDEIWFVPVSGENKGKITALKRIRAYIEKNKSQESDKFYEKEFVEPLIKKFIACETQKDISMVELIYADRIFLNADQSKTLTLSEMKDDCIKNWKRWPEREFELTDYVFEKLIKSSLLCIQPTFRFAFKSGDKQSKGYSRQKWFVETIGKNKGKIVMYDEKVELIK